ncbi:MAG: SUF system Fe-S cluster assembly protein [Hyphomicrobiaceae bacterium]
MLELNAASGAAAPVTDTGREDAVAETTATPERHPKALDLDAPSATGSALSSEVIEQMTADIVAAIKTVYDPEIPADIYELGLIYRIDMDDDRNVDVVMTLTAPGCPVAGEMPIWVENAVASVAGVGRVHVELTFDPPWEMSRMSDEARLALNMF